MRRKKKTGRAYWWNEDRDYLVALLKKQKSMISDLRWELRAARVQLYAEETYAAEWFKKHGDCPPSERRSRERANGR